MKPSTFDDGEFFKTKLKAPDGAWVKRGLGTKDPVVAADICAMGTYLETHHVTEVLDRITLKPSSLTLPDAYAIWSRTPSARNNPRTGRPMAPSDDERLEHLIAQLTTVGIDALITQWAKGAIGRYVDQVREMFPAGTTLTVADFTQPAVAKFLASLQVTPNTKRRYRTALSMFAKWLLDPTRSLIASNPARDVPLPKVVANTDPIFLEPEQAKRLILGQHGEQQALEALMFASGIEWQALERLTPGDVDVETRMVLAHGGKTKWRKRWVEVTEAWAWDLFLAWVKTRTPAAPVFTVKHELALINHHRAAKALKLPHTYLHHYRHGFAVMWIKRGAFGNLREDGRDKGWLKNQLGHSPRSTLAETVYGFYVGGAHLSARQRQRLDEVQGIETPKLAVMK